jgi:ribosomal-protein-serine acetyltransferase
MQSDEQAIDELAAQFFGAFTNCAGAAPDVDRLYRLFARDARIINNAGAHPQVYDVTGFIEPRRAILTDGTLREFREEETRANTDIFGKIAHRFSRYRKTWVASGERYEGEGAKSLQFVRTPEGWKISSLIWDDV